MRRLGLLLLLACGRPLPVTTGDACEEASAARCDRGIACGTTSSTTRAGCITANVAACCAERGKCRTDSSDPYAARRCTDAFAVQGCGQWGNAVLPAECVGIPDMWQ